MRFSSSGWKIFKRILKSEAFALRMSSDCSILAATDFWKLFRVFQIIQQNAWEKKMPRDDKMSDIIEQLSGFFPVPAAFYSQPVSFKC